MATLKKLDNRERKWLIRWHVTIKHGSNAGDIIKGSRTFKRKEDAQAFLADINKRSERWGAGLDVGNRKSKSRNAINNAVALWETHIKQYTPRTEGLYKSLLPRFINNLPSGIVSLRQVNTSHIDKHLDSEIENGNSHRYANIHLDAIRNFFKFCEHRFGTVNIAVQVPRRKEKARKQRFLTDEEYKKVMECVFGKTRDYFEFIANTGVRASEFCQISWNNISLDKKTVTVFGKGQKYRTIPLNATCLKIIDRYKENKPTIFWSKNGAVLTRHGLHKRCVAASQKANIEQFGPHALRHYFATRLLLKGVNMKIVSMLLGHTSVKTTEKVYIHIMPEDLNGVTDIIG